MFTPVFDGQFRSKRTVSLRGASKTGEKSNSFMTRVRHDRQEREKERLRSSSAVIIQSFYKGHLARKDFHRQLRQQFDAGTGCVHCTDPAHVYKLTTQLFLFYSEKIDYSRLVVLCQKWVQHKFYIIKDLHRVIVHQTLSRLLAICLSSLRYFPHQALAGPLRVIDVFTVDCDALLMEFLLRKGYYSTLRKLIEARIPPFYNEDTPLLPLATSLKEYIFRPISSNPPNLYEFILRELLFPPLTPHVFYFIIPALEKCELDLAQILKIVGCHSSVIPPTATLCYFILKLVHKSDFLSKESIVHLMLFLSQVLETISREKEGEINDEEDYDCDSTDEEEDMDIDPSSSSSALNQYVLSMISNGPFVDILLRNSDTVDPSLLCVICFRVSLLSDIQLPSRHKLLVSLSSHNAILESIWKSLSALTVKRMFGPSLNVLDVFRHGSSNLSCPEAHSLLHQLSTFSILFHLALTSLHDSELIRRGPFKLDYLSTITITLRDVFVNLHMKILHQSSLSLIPGLISQEQSQQAVCLVDSEVQFLAKVLYRVLKSLFDRNLRLIFCPPNSLGSLTLDDIPADLFYLEREVDDDGELMSCPLYPSVMYKQASLLRKTPFVFTFLHRFKFFRKLVIASRKTIQGLHQDFLIGPSISITARRSHLYEDAFSKLATEDLRKTVRVQLINEQGLEEAGIDGGGVFREFLTQTLKSAFDPNRGFFTSNKDGYLYPNPTAHLVNEHFHLHYKFIGALVGKAFLDNMLVELPFASFFLSKLITDGCGSVDVHQLGSLDSELYHHLLWLKNYEGDFDDLDLDFTTALQLFDQTTMIELKPNGANTKVTSSNCVEYINAVADYHLNKKINQQFHSFKVGLDTMIPIEWLAMFNQYELQVLLSGVDEPIDMVELRRHTNYSGDYKEDHECIVMFWDIVSEFTEHQKKLLLKFVTSCSRPPLLGFKELHPSFTILPGNDPTRLPSASTCMNVLKLPMFKTKENMKTKLLYAISSDAGFELS